MAGDCMGRSRKQGKFRQLNWKNRGYDTVVMLAPLKINGIDYIGEVVVKQGNERQGFYLHEVEIKEKLADVFKTANGSTLPTSKLIISQLLAKIKEQDKKNLEFSRKRIFTGSAASYDKPSLQYIGTGEGAQAYGWGLYGSESRKVAEWYANEDADRKNYSNNAVIKYMGTPYSEKELFDFAQSGDADFKMLAHVFSRGGVQNAISELEQQIERAKQKKWHPDLYEWQEDLLKDIKEAQDDIEYLGNTLEGKRHLYSKVFIFLI